MPQNVDIVGHQYIAINIVNVWWWITYPVLCNTSPRLGAGALMLNAWTGLLQLKLGPCASFLMWGMELFCKWSVGPKFRPGSFAVCYRHRCVLNIYSGNFTPEKKILKCFTENLAGPNT